MSGETEAMARLRANGHAPTAMQTQRSWRPACECGWKASELMSLAETEKYHNAHLRGLTS